MASALQKEDVAGVADNAKSKNAADGTHILPIVPPPQYKRTDNVLVVGDGNFSFSAAFVKAVHKDSDSSHDHKTELPGGCLCFTSYDSFETVVSKYPDARRHIEFLKACDRPSRRVVVLHGIDATDLPPPSKMVGSADAPSNGWDYILFNFPLAAHTCSDETAKQNLHPAIPNRWLLHRFLLAGSKFLRPTGKMVITTKFSYRYQLWRIESLAPSFEGVAPFDIEQFPGYSVRKIDMSKPDGSDLAFGMAGHSAVTCNDSGEAAAVTRRASGALSFLFGNPASVPTGSAIPVIVNGRILLENTDGSIVPDTPQAPLPHGHPVAGNDLGPELSKTARKKRAKALKRAAEKAARLEKSRKRKADQSHTVAELTQKLQAAGARPACQLCYIHCNSLAELARHSLGEKHRRRAEVELRWRAYCRNQSGHVSSRQVHASIADGESERDGHASAPAKIPRVS